MAREKVKVSVETSNPKLAEFLRKHQPDWVVREPGRHASDCAVHNEPAFPSEPCDCGAEGNA